MSDIKSTCSKCNGKGIIKCPGCGGSGKLEQINEIRGETAIKVVSCAGCHGRGTRTCGLCGGSGQK
ncbi:MAG TPA: hypothetical protein VFC67_05615 [Prolixibacteraceae bacterium]|nr:hypothetical protein [Prolixibacteraceae bacterium]